MKNNVSVRKLARCAVVAALYVVLCMALQPLSYGAVQVRVAEALCLLPVFGAEYIAGVVLGCFLANLLGSTIVDVILGTLATLLACVVTYKLRNVRIGGLAIPASLPPVAFMPSSSALRSRCSSRSRAPRLRSGWPACPTASRWASASSSAVPCWVCCW